LLVPPITTAVIVSGFAPTMAFGLAGPALPIRIQAVDPSTGPATV
jgi:hypothetical protein